MRSCQPIKILVSTNQKIKTLYHTIMLTHPKEETIYFIFSPISCK